MFTYRLFFSLAASFVVCAASLAQDSDIDQAKKQFEQEKVEAAERMVAAYKNQIEKLEEAGKTDESKRLEEEMREFGVKHELPEFTVTYDFKRDIKNYIDQYKKASELETDLLRDEKRREIAKQMVKHFNGRRFEYRLIITDVEKLSDDKFKLTLDNSKGLEYPYISRQLIDSVTVELSTLKARKLRPGDFVEIDGRIDLSSSDRMYGSSGQYKNARGKPCFPVMYFDLDPRTRDDLGFGDGLGGIRTSGSRGFLKLALYDVDTKVVFHE